MQKNPKALKYTQKCLNFISAYLNERVVPSDFESDRRERMWLLCEASNELGFVLDNVFRNNLGKTLSDEDWTHLSSAISVLRAALRLCSDAGDLDDILLSTGQEHALDLFAHSLINECNRDYATLARLNKSEANRYPRKQEFQSNIISPDFSYKNDAVESEIGNSSGVI